MSERSRAARTDLERYFLTEEAVVRMGAGTSADGEATALINVELKGRWNGGRAQTLELLTTPSLARNLSELLTEGAALADLERDAVNDDPDPPSSG